MNLKTWVGIMMIRIWLPIWFLFNFGKSIYVLNFYKWRIYEKRSLVSPMSEVLFPHLYLFSSLPWVMLRFFPLYFLKCHRVFKPDLSFVGLTRPPYSSTSTRVVLWVTETDITLLKVLNPHSFTFLLMISFFGSVNDWDVLCFTTRLFLSLRSFAVLNRYLS